MQAHTHTQTSFHNLSPGLSLAGNSQQAADTFSSRNQLIPHSINSILNVLCTFWILGLEICPIKRRLPMLAIHWEYDFLGDWSSCRDWRIKETVIMKLIEGAIIMSLTEINPHVAALAGINWNPYKSCHINYLILYICYMSL